MTEKNPAYQWYPGDWRRDPGVQALDYEHRGVWRELIDMMHWSPERGRLLFATGAVPDDADIARMLGIDEAKWKQIRSKLLSTGVASEGPDGALICRRMWRDEQTLQARREAGRKGGTVSRPKQPPSKLEANAKQTDPPPSPSPTPIGVGGTSYRSADTYLRGTADVVGGPADGPHHPEPPPCGSPSTIPDEGQQEPSPPEATFRCRGGQPWEPPPDLPARLAHGHPRLDIPAELVRAREWTQDPKNTSKLKTPGGMTRFLWNWMRTAEKDLAEGIGRGARALARASPAPTAHERSKAAIAEVAREISERSQEVT